MAKPKKQASEKVKKEVREMLSKEGSVQPERPLKASKDIIKKAKDVIVNKLKSATKVPPKKIVEIKKEALLEKEVIKSEPVVTTEIGHIVKADTKQSNTISFNDIKSKLNVTPPPPKFTFFNR